MRITIIIYATLCLLLLCLWVTLSGALLFVSALILAIVVGISYGYSDTVLLYLLGGREVRSSDQKDFFEAASQEAYKLAVHMPNLYFYNGTLERAFVLQNHQSVSIVMSKGLLDKCTSSELSAICFELLLQVKKGMAIKRTKSMFFLGLIAWLCHWFVGIFLRLIPIKEVKQVGSWVLNYLLHPFLDFLFRIVLGKSYFKKLGNLLLEYPEEKELLKKVGLKLRRPVSYYSLPSRKLLELSSSYKSRHYQRILALEFLPHEWDFLFAGEEITRAE